MQRKTSSHKVDVLRGRGIQKRQDEVEKRKKENVKLTHSFKGSLTEMLTKIDSIQLESGTPHSMPSNAFTQPINTKCSCGNVENQKKTAVASSSESDDEDEVGVGKIISMLMSYTKKPMKKDKSPALINLVSSYKPETDCLNAAHLQQLMLLLNSSSNTVKSCSLLLLTRLGVMSNNTKKLIENGFLEKILRIVEDHDIPNLKYALKCINVLVSHKELSDCWMLFMVQRGLPSLLDILCSNVGENSIEAGMSVLCSLASHHEVAVLLVDHGIQVILESLKRLPKLCESVINMFTHIISHNDQLMAAVIDNNIFREIDRALRVGLCSEQIAAMGFCSQLCQDSYGIACILEEDKLKLLCQLLQSTNCVKIRALGVKVIKSLLKCQDSNLLKELINQFGKVPHKDEYFEERSDLQALPKHTTLGVKRQETQSRADRGVERLSRLLINLLHREGKITVNAKGNLQFIGFKAAHDPYFTLSDLVTCLFLVSTLPLNRPRRRTMSSKKLLFPCFSNKYRKPNLKTSSYLIETGALNLIHVLNTYSRLLGTARHHGENNSDRSLDTLHLQAIMKVWQNETTENMLLVRSLADVLCSEELTFVLKMVSLMKLFAQISCTEWNSGLKERLQESIASGGSERESNDPSVPDMFGDAELPNALCSTNGITMTEVQDSGDGLLEIRAVEHKPDSDNSGVVTKKVAWQDGKPDVNEDVVNSKQYCRKLLSETFNKVEYNVHKIDDTVCELHRKIRINLCQQGLIDVLSLLVRCGVPQLEAEVLETMKCLLQPVKPEEVAPRMQDSKSLPIKQKSLTEITKSLEMRDRLLSSAINNMTKKTADVMKEALKTGPLKKMSKVDRTRRKTEMKETPNFASSIMKSPECISWHCTMYWLEISGHVIIRSLQDRDDVTTERLLLIIYDILVFGDIIIYMKLASVGLIPVLLELNCNDHHSDINKILAVVVLQKLTQDRRIKEMCKTESCFYELKMKFPSGCNGILKQELEYFFKGVEVPTDSLGLDIKAALGT